MTSSQEPQRRRRSARFVFLAALGLATVIGATAVGVLYHEPIVAWMTHWTGSPRDKTPFVAIPESEAPALRLAVAGDIGDGGDLVWRLAGSLYTASRSDPVDGLLLLGDNVYPDGDPARLDDFVFRPFAAVLDSGAQLYAVAGNHDAKQDDAGAEQLSRLGMPGLWWSERIGDVLLIGLDSNQAFNVEQRAWLESTLAASDAPWRLVALHHPPYSAGYQGSDEDARTEFSPIFERYGVQLVLSGHDHDYQRSIPVNGVTYVVSGAGSGTRRTGSADYTAYSAAAVSFVELNIYPGELLLRSIDHELMIFDEHTIAR